MLTDGQPGAFDEAVKGVDAIEHTASPVHLNADDPDEFIVPAVKGTIGVLESALAHGTSVKRVVYTSSCVSILRIPEQPTVFSEKDWNEQAVEDVKANGRNATGLSKYSASKVLAERAAWEFVEKNKARIAWDLVVVNPPYVFGPTLNEVDKPESLHSSMDEWFKAVCGGIYNTAPWGLSVSGAPTISMYATLHWHMFWQSRKRALVESVSLSPRAHGSGKTSVRPRLMIRYATEQPAHIDHVRRVEGAEGPRYQVSLD